MQGGKSSSAVEAAKEAAANVGASAWAGKEKTKAVVQGAAAKATAHDPAAREAAEARKLERVREVEAQKRDAMRHNAAAKERATAAGFHHTPTTTAAAAMDQSAAPEPAGAVKGSRPIAATETEARAAGPAITPHHVPRAGSGGAYQPGHGGDGLPARGAVGGGSAST